MTEKKGLPQYRCQRCGCVTSNLDAPLVPYKLVDVLAQNPQAIAIDGVPLRGPHVCEDDGVGIATFCGLMPEPSVEHLKTHRGALRTAEEQSKKDTIKSDSSLN